MKIFTCRCTFNIPVIINSDLSTNTALKSDLVDQFDAFCDWLKRSEFNLNLQNAEKSTFESKVELLAAKYEPHSTAA